MEAKELIQLPNAELEKRLDDAYRELFNLRFQKAQRQLTDMNTMKRVRRDIARIKTVMRQRELATQLVKSAEAKQS